MSALRSRQHHCSAQDHDIDAQRLALDIVIVNPSVQARLSAIDARAKRVPQRATRQ
jgi:hypothetical protein